MKKTSNVKAPKLMVDDHIKIGGQMYRITHLSRNYGTSRDSIRIYLRGIENNSFMQLINVKPKNRFTIYSQ